MGDLNDFIPRLEQKDKRDEDLGVKGGKRKRNNMMDDKVGWDNSLCKVKLGINEDSNDSLNISPHGGSAQSLMKKVCTSRGILIKEIRSLWGAFLVGLNNIISYMK